VSILMFSMKMTVKQIFNTSIHLTARFQADNWNKLKNLCSKQIGEKMKVNKCILYQPHVAYKYVTSDNV
jgi:hypothetical protein